MTRQLSDVMAELTGPGGEFELVPVAHHGVTVHTFAGAPGSLTEAFGQIRTPGTRDAIIYTDERVSVAELIATTTRLAAALQVRYGVRPGDRICIAMRNYPEWVFWFWAAQLVGAVVVPLNAWSTGPELMAQVDHARPVLLAADRERIDRLAQVYGREIDGTVVVRVRAAAGELTSVPMADLVEHGLTFTPVSPPTGEDTATILYTSGTTGTAKGVIGTHLNHATSLRGVELRARARAIVSGTPDGANVETRALLTFPFFHIAGMATLYGCVTAGKPMVLMYKWDPREAVRLIERERVNELYGPPVVTRDFLAAAAESTCDLSSLRLASSGGSASNPTQIERLRRDFGGRVVASNAYGLTETTGTVVTQAGPEVFENPGALGRAVPGIEIRIVDDEGRPVPTGADGEIQVFGAMVSPGYLDNPAATALAFADGWFNTGDLGAVDADGRLRLRGRLKDIIIRGGENIACAEVERAIDGYPDVLESAVVGRPDPAMGEEVTAFVRPHEGVALDIDGLTSHLRGRLAAFKVPSQIIVTTEPLPRTATGKLQKRALHNAL
jgi:acyl-CoA synthetase (AMP-forming)/AMP-acid ligase II